MKFQSIIDAIKTQLQLITIANGYYNNANIFIARSTPLNDEELPAIIVREINADRIDLISGIDFIEINYEANLIVKNDSSAVEARKLLADFEKAFLDNSSLNGLTNGINIQSYEWVYADDIDVLLGIKIKFKTSFEKENFKEN